jgi:hypothetical protein
MFTSALVLFLKSVITLKISDILSFSPIFYIQKCYCKYTNLINNLDKNTYLLKG